MAQEITQATIGLYQLFHVLLKFLKKLSSINYMGILTQIICWTHANLARFRPFHSILTALLEATSDWSMNIDNSLILLFIIVFIDLKKAFDAIDHQIILQKLKNYGIDENSLTWFHSYLTDRTQKCRVNGQLSDSVPVHGLWCPSR